MKKVDQTIVDKGSGNCTTACLASLFEVGIDDLPNFITLGDGWFQVFWDTLKEYSCEYHGTGWLESPDRHHGQILVESPNIDGFVIASVESRTFKDVGHSVIMNLKGLVVHDPNPNKLWQYVNILESGDLRHWMMIGRISV